MRILITGGAGFIGSNFVSMVTTEVPSNEITVLDKLTYSGNLANLQGLINEQKINFVHGDILDASLVDDLIKSTDYVVHFAAESHVDRSIKNSFEFFQTNVLGTQVLLESALKHGIKKFIHVSTDEVYGSIDSGSWTEEYPLKPNSPYAASKAGSDLAVLDFYKTHELPVIVTRCSNNYGNNQYPEKIIPLFITNLISGKQVSVYGDGNNVRDWLHVSDHCRALMLILRSGAAGEVYNIGGGRELTNLELTKTILQQMNLGDDRIEWVNDRLGHDRRYSLDISKISMALGYSPQVYFESGIKETITWYLENEQWWKPLIAK
jgi:dTDP-glucose 4,6-dehydratase